MNSIPQNIEAFAVVLIVSMTLLTVAVALRTTNLKDIYEPDSKAPQIVLDTIQDASKGLINEWPPWISLQKGQLKRGEMKGHCTTLKAFGRECLVGGTLRGSSGGSASGSLGATSGSVFGTYAQNLPVIRSPVRPSVPEWDPYQTAFQLSTTQQFTTGYPVQYPAATVIAVPRETPKHVKFILDAATAASAGESDGIKALIQENNEPLNMEFDQRLGVGLRGLNVTGNFGHSFVLINNADHDMFFVRDSVPVSSNNESPSTYWRIRPGAWVLLWPAVEYWQNVDVRRRWQAYPLPLAVHDVPKAAYIAETLMFEDLRPTAPIVS